MKTVEEIVIQIQSGDPRRVPELWERVQKLYKKKCLRYYWNHRALCDRCGVDLDDIQQQAFFAMLRSVDYYEPETGYKFTAYIDFPFSMEMQELTHTRTSRQRSEPLNACVSLDKELETEDGDGSTLHDFVPDPESLLFMDALDAESVGELVRREVRLLPDPLGDIIAGIFFNGQTLKQIGDKYGFSQQYASNCKKRGLAMLSKRRALVELWNEYNHTATLRGLEYKNRSALPDSYSAVHAYEKAAQPHKSCVDYAEEYAQELRQAAESAGKEWTREDQISAILEYLRRPDEVRAKK